MISPKVLGKAIRILLAFLSVSIQCLVIRFYRGPKNHRINHEFASRFAQRISEITGVRSEIIGRENIAPGQQYVMVGNHQSELDLAFIGQACPENTVVIGKRELIWVPIFGAVFVMAGNIVIRRQKKRQAMAIINQVAGEIKSRRVSVCIFPEGTRNRTKEPMLPFKKGGFHMAIRAGVPILPVVSSRLDRYLDFERGVITPGVVQLRILPPVPTAGMTENDIDALTLRVRNLMLDALKTM